ncbi:hypothetical protein RJT34_02747 [Clitoria ternatea]|uniref:Uncharacterized protein n=1 Tax=Clitoria ternatea TaxID=43366 RepID=A0AAN9PZ62_CLITE
MIFVLGVAQVEEILDKENFTLEELLDEEEVIQECKALNSRLINLYVLRDQAQVEQLLRYIVEEPPEDAESKRVNEPSSCCLPNDSKDSALYFYKVYQHVFRQLELKKRNKLGIKWNRK